MAAAFQDLLSSVIAPINNEKVYKEECMYCYDTPESETGLYVCMKQFYAFGKRYVEDYSNKSNSRVFLHLRRIKKILPKEEEPERKKPTKIAIGVDGGFDTNEPKYEFEDKNSIVILPEWTVIDLDDPDLPGQAQLSVAAILTAQSATKTEEMAALNNTWEGEQRLVSKHAEQLMQMDNGKTIPPSGWKCEKCDLTNNLWLNLTDGSILCGRRYFDGTGGNNHAVEHYQHTRFPLSVKLGTITPEGADVYSYAEDDMVLDPLLDRHLAHFGIDIMKMNKTEKTMVELEIDLNQKIGEWDVIQESGTKLEPMFGPGFTGMTNLGNSCYMNSALQVLFTLHDFVNKYVSEADQSFAEAALDSVQNNFNFQMSKLGKGLLSGDYSKKRLEDTDIVYPSGISPKTFKLLVGKGHSEFSSKRQQDVQEFLLHLFNLIERNSRGSQNPLDCLKFKMEERVNCTMSKCVRYTEKEEYLLSLPVPLEASQNLSEVAVYEQRKKDLEAQGKQISDPKEVVRPIISLKSCLDAFAAVEIIDDYYSSALKRKTNASKCSRLATFPPYLFLHLKKFTISENWTPKKLDVSIDVPDELDLTYLRAQGRQPGEQDFPPDDQEDTTPQFEFNESIIAQLMDMGFHIEGCKKAVYHTQNAGVEEAMNWVMEHMADNDFEEPFVLPGTSSSKNSDFVPNEDGLAMIMAMGFTKEQATKALKATENNLERAADWIFSHAAELDSPMETEQEAEVSTSSLRDGSGKYRLKAFISHMGTSTDAGHYVCHINKDGRWVIFNDEKVALSQNPPKELAYMYLYERV